MFMILTEQVLLQKSPDAFWPITLHLENSETLLPLRPVATVLPEISALKKQIGNYNKDKGNGVA